MVGPRPSFDLDAKPVLAGAVAQFAVIIVPMIRLESSAPVFFGGVVAGAVAAALTDRYGSAMNNGLTAAGGAGVVACIVVACYGSYVSWSVGFGLDSVLAARWGFYAISMLVLAVPFQAVEGAIVAAVTASARERVSGRAA